MKNWTQEYQDGYEDGYKRGLEDVKIKLFDYGVDLAIFDIINELKNF